MSSSKPIRVRLPDRFEKSLIYRLFHRLFHSHLTPAGRALFWVGVLSSSLTSFNFVIKSYVVWSGIFALCAVSIVSARLARRKLRVVVTGPERVRHGQEFHLQITTNNLSKLPARDHRVLYTPPPKLRPAQDVEYAESIAPGAEQVFVQSFLPERRGAYVFKELRQETCFPFGLWRDFKSHQAEHAVLVYPKFHKLQQIDIPVGRQYQPGGLALTSYLGDSTEFLSMRDFRPGDPIRHIHWRSWARLGKPIVKEFGEEYFCRLALIVDTVVPDPSKPEALESAISLAASVTEYLSRQEYVIDIFAAGPKLYHLQAGRSLAYLQNIMDILACLEATLPDDDSFAAMENALFEEIEGISTTILVFTDWDQRRARLLELLKERGTAILGLLVTEDQDVAEKAPADVRWIKSEYIESGLDVL